MSLSPMSPPAVLHSPSGPAPRRRAARLLPLAAVLAGALLAGCGGAAGGGAYVDCLGTGTQVGGQAVYEDKLYDFHGFGAHPLKAVRYAVVEIRDAATDAVVATARTDARGTFCAALGAGTPPTQAYARVKADAAAPGGNTKVIDYNGDTYAADSDPTRVRAGEINILPRLVVREDTPWKTNGFFGSVSFAGGAFNILDVTIGGMTFVKTRWGRDLPDLQTAWQDSQFQGLGTFFSPPLNLIHVKGTVLNDSDEYDDDIILHEFGHFVMHSLSTDSSPGGTHYINGNTQDTRLAWSEGWANFFSGLVRDADPGGFSNVSGVRASFVDALFTEKQARAVRFAFEMQTPQAYVPDDQTPANDPVSVTPELFKDRVKYGTSEVSVAAALWDIYAGVGAVPGIGRDGILAVIEQMKADAPAEVSFASFWDAFERIYPAEAAQFTGDLVDDRLMALDDDARGADDTPAELDGLAGPGLEAQLAAHQFVNLVPGFTAAPSRGHTLYPEGDVDLFRLKVEQAGTFEITTTNLNDGADTMLRILDQDGVPLPVPEAESDNYIPYVIGARFFDTDHPEGVVVTRSFLDYGGHCGGVLLQYRTDTASVSNCPPNAANPPSVTEIAALGAAAYDTEYLASQVTVDLAAGTYYAEVTRSASAPSSAGAFGGYDLEVAGLPSP